MDSKDMHTGVMFFGDMIENQTFAATLQFSHL